MNQISHRQAIQWIDRRLDGLLMTKQAVVLEGHLRSCDSCRAYAAEMDLLPARLQKEFHARWDKRRGPSPKIMQHITTKARSIPVANRISSASKLFAGAAALVLLGFTINFIVSELRNTFTAATGMETVITPSLSGRRLLAFASTMENGNSDIYTMRPDGSELTNLTNNPAHDLKPFWSPDGKRIAFESDRDGNDFTQIFLMNADGSDVFQVTNGEVHHQLVSNSWSPDGSRLIFIEWDPANEKMALYTIGTDGENKTFLAQVPVSYSYPSWSPDGKYVAFVSRESQDLPTSSHLFVVDKNGDHLIRLAESLPADEGFIPSGDYHWSQDGKSIFFIAESHSSPDKASIVYKAGLDGSLTAMTTANKPILDWWNGTALGLAEHGTTLTWLRSDGSQATLGLCRSTDQALGMAYARSHNGDLVFGSNCSASGWMLYWANSDGTLTDKLPDLGIPSRYDILDMTWSPDDHFLAFLVHDTDSPVIGETLYVLDVAQARRDPSVQPVKIASNYGGTSWQPAP